MWNVNGNDKIWYKESDGGIDIFVNEESLIGDSILLQVSVKDSILAELTIKIKEGW